MSRRVNTVHPASFAKISSAFGKGYFSVSICLLAVTLKSPHILIFPLVFRTGTIGAADCAYGTGDIIFASSRRCSSSLTFSL